MNSYDDDENDWEDPDYDSEDYSEDDQFPCPDCGKPVYEDADVCPACGYFILDSDRTSFGSQPKTMFRVLGVIGIIATMIVLSGLLQLL